MARPDPDNIIPRTGGRPETLSVFDMRRDRSGADRVLAESIQGLANADANRIDKLYLIFNDQDATRLNYLLKEQYVLSQAHIQTLEELMRRVPVQDALLFDRASLNIAPALAGCERMLLVADPRMIQKFHLKAKMDLRGKFRDPKQATGWLLDNYRDRVNRRVLSLAGELNLVDYQVANKVVALPSQDLGSDELQSELVHSFDSTIPCLGSVTGDQAGQSVIDGLSRGAKFFVPTDNLTNLSVWTTFHPAVGEFGTEFMTNATRQPRAIGKVDPDTNFPTTMGFETRLEDQVAVAPVMSPKLNLVLMQLAPPLGPSHYDQSLAYQIGFVSEGEYGKAYGMDRERVVADYQWLGEQMVRRAR